jgi:exosortase
MTVVERYPLTIHAKFDSLARANLVLALKILTLVAGIIILYLQDLSMIFHDALYNESTSYVLLIPLIFAYLIYRKRKMLRTAISTESGNRSGNMKYVGILSGILLCTIGIILYWYGSYTFTPLEYHTLTLPFFAAGLTLVLFNPQTLRQAVFPIAFLAFLTPPPSDILQNLGSVLSVTSTELSNWFVNLLGIQSTISGEYGTPTINIIRPDHTSMSFTVDIACSGIYSLIGFLVFAAFVAFIVRDKLWKKAAIFILGFPLIYLLNTVRIATIVLIGYQWGEQLALDLFHLLGGWVLIFIGTLILLTIAEKAFKTRIFTGKQPQDTCQACNPHVTTQSAYCASCGRLVKYPPARFRTIDAAKIMAAVLAIALLISIQAPVFALTRGPAQILVQTPSGEQGNTELLPHISGYTMQFVFRDKEFEGVSGQDFSLIYEYTPQDQSKKPLWVTIEIAGTRSRLHGWEFCLVTWPQAYGYQPEVNQLDLRDVSVLENPPIIARYFAFQYKNDNQTQLVLYWFESTVFTINNASAQKQVKLSLIAYPDKPEDVPNIEEELLPIATAMVGYWQPIRTWNAITMLISHNGISLAGTIVAILVVLVILYAFELREQRKANANAYGKLSVSNRQLVDIIQKTEKQTTPTLDELQRAYQDKTMEPVDSAQLEQKLAELEKIGVIARTIVNRQDEPRLTWKTQITFSIRKQRTASQ